MKVLVFCLCKTVVRKFQNKPNTIKAKVSPYVFWDYANVVRYEISEFEDFTYFHTLSTINLLTSLWVFEREWLCIPADSFARRIWKSEYLHK